ncbi:hypothetical protein B0H10DRAFT_807089 [Mycena sp. CBHHK59/15]|nr:hypothetical protein B0H10DRAFT_807089 [Mycena sp. CBHHK59/15]
METKKSIRKRPSKPRAQPLRRGKACLNCRHLKIRCDGVHPICGNCTRVPKDDPCEYTDVTSKTMELENTVFQLQSSLNDLANVPGTWGSAGSYNSRSDSRHISGSPEFSVASSPYSDFSAESAPHTPPDIFIYDEPNFGTIQALLQYFLPHA